MRGLARFWAAGLVAMATVALTACSAGGNSRPSKSPIALSANPGAVIAAEMGFARAAQEQGQWTAFARAAAPGAQMFVPQRADAAQWLKGRANPPVAVRWQPHAVWSSCDGGHAVTHGDWERPGSTGSYTTVWQRQADGQYKWLLDMSLATENAYNASDMVSALVADCSKADVENPISDTPAGSGMLTGRSADGSLVWQTLEQGDGRREIAVFMRREGRMKEVLRDSLLEPSAETR